MKTISSLSLPVGLLMCAVAPSIAAAQSTGFFARDRNVAVTQRPQPDYEALGFRLGSFRLYPSLQADAGYASNVLAADTNEQSDLFYRLSPKIEAESDWGRHSLTGALRSSTTRYQDLSDEGSTTWGVGGAGRYDVTREATVTGGLDYSRQIEPRTSSNRPDLIAQPEYSVLAGYVGASNTFNRLRASGRFDLRAYEFKDGVSSGGAVISQRDRDQTTYEATGRLDYALSPATALFGSLSLNDRQFDTSIVATTPNRSSSGYRALLGANFEASNLVRGEVGIGYLRQEYDNTLYGEFSGATGSVKLEYFATPLLTVGVRADRSIGDSGIPGTAGFLSTLVEATADYEFRRNILLNARFGRDLEELDVIDRENERLFGGVRMTYLMNRRLGLTASYDYESRDSSGAAAITDFTAHRWMVSVVAQY